MQVIDVAGAWEVFQDTYRPGQDVSAFEPFTVSETVKRRPRVWWFDDRAGLYDRQCPVPDVVVVPHFDYPKPATRDTSPIHDWIKATHGEALLTTSVCTGAFQIAKTGLLNGIPMTTNRKASDNFEGVSRNYAAPGTSVRRGGAHRHVR